MPPSDLPYLDPPYPQPSMDRTDTHTTACFDFLLTRCRQTCQTERPDKIKSCVAKSDNKEKVHMYVQKCNIYIVILRKKTSAKARSRRPAGEIARRIPPLESGHPHTSIPRTATHDRAYNNAAMRKHAPQPQTHITTAATIDPLIMHRRPT